jgi:hypothetical protein
MDGEYGKIEKLIKKPVATWDVDECIVFLTASEKSQGKLKEFGTKPADARNGVGQHLKALMDAAERKALTVATTTTATATAVSTIKPQSVVPLQHAVVTSSSPQPQEIKSDMYMETIVAMLQAMQTALQTTTSSTPTTIAPVRKVKTKLEAAPAGISVSAKIVISTGANKSSKKKGAQAKAKTGAKRFGTEGGSE